MTKQKEYILPCPCGCGKDMKIILKGESKPLVFLIEKEQLSQKELSEGFGIELGITEGGLNW